MEQLKRIAYYEELLNKGNKILKEYQSALEKYQEFQTKLLELEHYYGSEEWYEDLKADELGLINIPRGVLSQDAIYNLLELNDELKKLQK